MVAEPSPEYADDITKRSILLDTVLIHALISSSPHRHLSSIIILLTVTLSLLQCQSKELHCGGSLRKESMPYRILCCAPRVTREHFHWSDLDVSLSLSLTITQRPCFGYIALMVNIRKCYLLSLKKDVSDLGRYGLAILIINGWLNISNGSGSKMIMLSLRSSFLLSNL
jgi:hypothetical protein